jgi:hypothetical protein
MPKQHDHSNPNARLNIVYAVDTISCLTTGAVWPEVEEQTAADRLTSLFDVDTRLKGDDITLLKVEHELMDMLAAADKSYLLADNASCSLINVDCQSTKRDVLAKAKRLANAVLQTYHERAMKSTADLFERYNPFLERLKADPPRSLEELHAILSYCESLDSMLDALAGDVSALCELLALLELFRYSIPDADFDQSFSGRALPKVMCIAREQCKLNTIAMREQLVEEFHKDRETFMRDLDVIFAACGEVKLSDNIDIYAEVEDQIVELLERLNWATEQVELVHEREGIIGEPLTDFTRVETERLEMEPYVEMWGIALLFFTSEKEWRFCHFEMLAPPEVLGLLSKWSANLYRLVRGFRKVAASSDVGLAEGDVVVTIASALREKVIEFDDTINQILGSLRADGLDASYWARMQKIITDLPSLATVTLSELLAIGIADRLHEVQHIIEEAKARYKLKVELQAMQVALFAARFSTGPHQIGVEIVSNSESILNLLEEQDLQVQVTACSGYTSTFTDSLKVHEENVAMALAVMRLFHHVQSLWLELSPIFAVEELATQIQDATVQYSRADTAYQTCARRLIAEKSVCRHILDYGEDYKLELAELQSEFESCRSHITAYLEFVCLQAPRLFFVPSSALITMLTDKNLQLASSLLKECFATTVQMRVITVHGVDQVIGMKSGDRVDFEHSMVHANRAVHEWLPELEAKIVMSLKNITTSALGAFATQTRDAWDLSTWPSQTVQACSQTVFTHDIEDLLNGLQVAMLAADRNRLQQSAVEFAVSQVEATAATGHHEGVLRDELKTKNGHVKEQERTWVAGQGELATVLEHYRTDILQPYLHSLIVTATSTRADDISLLASMVVLHLHMCEIVQSFILNASQMTIKNFEWLARVRFYCFDSLLCAAQLDRTVDYGYEYIGSVARLAITPQVDRYHHSTFGVFGSALLGSETGKVSTIVDMSVSIAKHCVVRRCTKNTTYKPNTFIQLLKAASSANIWIILAGLEGVNVSTMSILAETIRGICNAMQCGLESTSIGGVAAELGKAHNIFVVGISELKLLPLVSSFQSVCTLCVPDLKVLLEIELAATGFQEATQLASKIVLVFKLLNHVLPDDSIRRPYQGRKAVLQVAKSAKRMHEHEHATISDSPDKIPLSEEQAVVNALAWWFLPTIAKEHMRKYRKVLLNIFPDCEPDKDHQCSIQSLALKITPSQTKTLSKFEGPMVNKCIELQTYMQQTDILCSLVVGPPASGKTTVISALAESIGERSSSGAVIRHVLYGHDVMFPDVGEKNYRTIIENVMVKCQTQRDREHWIVVDLLDGDLSWFNLVASCRGGLGLEPSVWSHVKILLETDSLKNATPSDLSSCGVVYLPPVTQLPTVSCIDILPESWQKYAEVVDRLLVRTQPSPYHLAIHYKFILLVPAQYCRAIIVRTAPGMAHATVPRVSRRTGMATTASRYYDLEQSSRCYQLPDARNKISFS